MFKSLIISAIKLIKKLSEILCFTILYFSSKKAVKAHPVKTVGVISVWERKPRSIYYHLQLQFDCFLYIYIYTYRVNE